MPHLRYTTWHYPYKKIDSEALKEAFFLFIGKKDFSSFTTKEYDNPICHLEKIELEIPNSYQMILHLTADRFLYKMARILVGTLVKIAIKELLAPALKQLFHSKKRAQTGMTAPALGLCLEKVYFNPPFP